VVRAIPHACPALTDLDLSGVVSGVDDELARLIGESSPQLKVLDLSGCTRLSDDGVCALINSLPPRVTLDLSAQRDTGPAFPPKPQSVQDLEETPALERLGLHGLGLLTDRTVAAIARRALAMVELCLSSVPRLTDAAIVSLSTGRSCPGLRWLNVCGAYKISGDAMRGLLHAKPTLLVYIKPEDFPHCEAPPSDAAP